MLPKVATMYHIISPVDVNHNKPATYMSSAASGGASADLHLANKDIMDITRPSSSCGQCQELSAQYCEREDAPLGISSVLFCLCKLP